MSQATAKQARREIRRAVGDEALGIIEAHTSAIDHQILPNQNALQERVQNIDERLKLLAKWARVQDECYHGDLQWVQGYRRFGFWHRFRWLLRGK